MKFRIKIIFNQEGKDLFIPQFKKSLFGKWYSINSKVLHTKQEAEHWIYKFKEEHLGEDRAASYEYL
jgi:hypothetical protein